MIHNTKTNKKIADEQRTFNPFYKKIIKRLLQIKRTGHGKITFYFKDGTMQSTPFSMDLFTNEKGEERRFGEIISILNDFKHDFRAKSYDIT